MMDDGRRRGTHFLAAFAVIAAGLALRLVGPSVGVPVFIWKYAGSALWGAMVYLIVATLAPREPVWRIAAMACGIAMLVEFFRLYHTPWLDAFRLTMAGKLLIGRVFSLWNIVAYGVGILGGVALDRRLARASRCPV